MEFMDFMSSITEQIKEYLPEAFLDANVSIIPTQKNNGVTLHGLSIKRQEEKVAPSIYMEGYYEQYENGRSLESILGHIAEVHTNGMTDQFNDIGDWFSDYDKIKERLVLQVVNRDKNASLLETLPHKDLENTDLIAIYKVLLETQEHGYATIGVNNEHIGHWGIDSNALYQAALENTERLCPVQIANIYDIMSEISGGENKSQKELSDYVIEPYNQYVLTNEQRVHGASVMLYPEVLQRLAENSGGNLFILPSSIHEILLMKDDGRLNAAELQAMVMEVNRAMVEPEELLSNEVYYYDKEGQSLSVATDKEQTKELLERLGAQWGSDEMENEWEQEV